MATAPAPQTTILRGANGSPDYAGAGQTTAAYQNTPASTAAYSSSAAPNGGTQVHSAGGGNYTTFSPTTTSANISNPVSTVKTPAPAVITSTAAQNDLASKQSQVDQLNADTANHQAVVSASQAPPATDTSATTTPASNTPSNTDTLGSLDDQINGILSGFSDQSSKIESDANTQAGTLGDEATAAQTALDTAATTALSQLNAIASGTYPLSPAESSLLNATASGYQQAIQYQTTANASYTGQMTEAMASLGISTSAPTEAIGLIHAAISSGTSKITDLNSQMATSLANLQLGFQKQDYQMVQDSWDETSKYMEDRVSTLTAMQKQVTDAAHQQVQDLQAQTQMNLSTIIDSAKFDYQQKQDAITDAFQQQQITETQRHDLQEEATAAETAAYGRYSYDAASGTIFDKATGTTSFATGSSFVGASPGKTGVPIVDSNTKTTSTGVSYIDGTNLTGADAQTAARAAAQMGITYLGSAGTATVNKLEEARTNLANIDSVLSGTSGGPAVSPGNTVEFAGDSLVYPIESATQSGTYGTTLAAYNTFRSAAIGALQAVAGGTGSGLRINQAEIEMSINNDIPKPTDTAAVRDQKLANMTSLLDSNESQLLGTNSVNNSSNTNPLSLPSTSSGTTNGNTSSNNQLGI